MKTCILVKPGSTKDLALEARLLKAGLLLSNQSTIYSKELDLLQQVNLLPEQSSVEKQYATILKAMPTLSPETDIQPLKESLNQIKSLKNKRRKSSTEIIALKKGQKKLGQINNTFRIVTEALFQSSGLKEMFQSFEDEITITNSNQINTSFQVYLLPKDLIDIYDTSPITKSVSFNEIRNTSIIGSIKLGKIKSFDQLSIIHFPEARLKLSDLFAKLLEELKDIDNNNNHELIKTATNFRKTIQSYDFRKKKSTDKSKKTTSLNLFLGICNAELLQDIISSMGIECNSFEPQASKLSYFFYTDAVTVNKKEKAEDAVLQKL